MPKVSRRTGEVLDAGPVEDRHADLDGYTVNFVTFHEEIDHTPLFKGLPDDRCQCPHWGYVFNGKMTYSFADHDETHQAGDAFYTPPGHTLTVSAGTEFLQFSPTDELRKTESVMMKNMQGMQGISPVADRRETMAEDRSYVDVNTRERERLRAFIERVDDGALSAPANEYWTVAGVLGHLAYWDCRVLVFAEKIDRGEPWVPTDAEPEGDWLTDSTRPIIHAIEPRRAAQLALEIAEEADRRVAELPLDRMAPRDPDSPIYPVRGEHRGEHLDEIEAALKELG
jgi:hypothetical protein